MLPTLKSCCCILKLLQSTKKQKLSMETHVLTNSKHLRASCEASYLTAKSKKPFTIGEELVLPVAVRMTEIIHGHKHADEFLKISLSDSTVSRRIEDTSKDQFEQLIASIKGNSKYAIQIDEIQIFQERHNCWDMSDIASIIMFMKTSSSVGH